MITLDPRFATIEKWTGQMNLLIGQYGFLPKLTSERDWKRWARSARSLPKLGSAGTIPDPALYEDWRVWAARLNQVLVTL